MKMKVDGSNNYTHSENEGSLYFSDSEYFHQILKSLRLGTIFEAPEVRQMSGLKKVFKKLLLTKPRMEDCK